LLIRAATEHNLLVFQALSRRLTSLEKVSFELKAIAAAIYKKS